MSNPRKQKGTRFETAVVELLKELFPFVERRAPSGSYDRGDIAGIEGFAIECKNHTAMDLSSWMNEARAESLFAKEPFAAVVHSRRGKSTAQSYVTMELCDWAVLVQGWVKGQRAERQLERLGRELDDA